MKTKFTYILAACILFNCNRLSLAGSPDSGMMNSYSANAGRISSIHTNADGEKNKSDKKKIAETVAAPVNVSNEKSDFSYLRFEVDNFYSTENDELSELPLIEYNYLRFNINELEEINPKDLTELPATDNEFEYLKFDVSKYNAPSVAEAFEFELPVVE